MSDFFKFFNEKMKKEKFTQIQLELEIEPPQQIKEDLPIKEDLEKRGVTIIDLF